MRRKVRTLGYMGNHPAMRDAWAGKRVLIRSDEHRAWWRADRSGYTTIIREAGIYSFPDAYDATAGCGPEKRISYQEITPMQERLLTAARAAQEAVDIVMKAFVDV